MSTVGLGMPSVAKGLRTQAGPAVSETAPAAPTSGPLVDTYGRVARDLRVSLTDRCNLRCTYCMPAEGLDWMPSSAVLTTSELQRLIRIAVTLLGVREIRFTGGEPLLYARITELVAATAALEPRPEISLTTNALGLQRKAAALKAAGLDRVNVSLDTVNARNFHTLTRRDRLADVLQGLAAASEAGLTPVKVNAVLQPGINDLDAPELLQFCLDHGYELRFIEQMPLDAEHGWRRDRFVTAEQILASLARKFTLTPHSEHRGSAPAERFWVDGGPATVGIIASVTRPFCGDCDRTRLTADGQIRSCLFSHGETDLRALLRGDSCDQVADGAEGDAVLAQAWRAAMWRKLPGHGINDPGFLQPHRSMSAIGG
ncbi:GTP 3',8-cyclase MoaA [Hoyosella sp. YIM 151337]|uniref:GTP 3',8-cyclase MoaA n=1 Tax=Hoyosella sp. YIM 151337 TaxID=2992742 RepID=UPI00223633E4|nr:GTP 3',8-cyclase MoaA [Hoyosella sp. YIM 151337]MCW4356020.1 GTP 3',8-cyclase MoaA [Hoyosella sp. YIM 151337]